MASTLAAPASAPRAFVDRGARGRSRRARTPSPRASARGSRGARSLVVVARADSVRDRVGARRSGTRPRAARAVVRAVPPRADARGDAFGAEGGGYLEVEGGARLSGLARVGGAKNAVLALLAGALACREPVLLRGVPYLRDVLSMIDVLRSVGAVVHLDARGPGTVLVDASELTSDAPDPDAVRKLRASFFAAGPILGRLGSVRMPLPGGCAIGARPVDLHLAAFEALGADVEVTPDGVVIARATSRGEGGGDKKRGGGERGDANRPRLRGAGAFRARYPSVGATLNAVVAAALADGETIVANAAAEPEVVDLCAMLVAAGAKIAGAGTSEIRVEGVASLRGCRHDAIPDRIEAGTLLVAAACTRSTVTLAPVVPEHVAATLDVLRAAGCEIAVAEHREDPGGRGGHLENIFGGGGGGAGGGATRAALTLTPPRGGAPLAAFDVATAPHPGPPTDMQPQFCVLAAVAAGTSTIRETVFENRFSHVRELAKMGCDATREGEVITVRGAGGVPLRAADVRGSDLRASAALVLAGLASDGATRVEGLKHLDRGYERLDEKLAALGAVVRRREWSE